MDFPTLFTRLGRGFGLVKAMQTVTTRINDLRIQLTDGLLPAQEEMEQERRLVQRLADYMSDRRWDEVVELKEQGRVEEARERAQDLRRSYDL